MTDPAKPVQLPDLDVMRAAEAAAFIVGKIRFKCGDDLPLPTIIHICQEIIAHRLKHYRQFDTETRAELIANAVQPNGNLYDLGWYLAYEVGDRDATLDGRFTAEEMRAIADYMDRFQKERRDPANVARRAALAALDEDEKEQGE